VENEYKANAAIAAITRNSGDTGTAKNTSGLQMSHAHILVVDDVLSNLMVAKGLMEPYGVHIYLVKSGQKAVDMIREEKVRFDVVFMDHLMPEMDGIEAVRIIREEIGSEYARTVPIIALTANTSKGNEAMFLERGFQDYLPKPIDVFELERILRKWIARQ
jgi:CheY-like chemotaxis protein